MSALKTSVARSSVELGTATGLPPRRKINSKLSSNEERVVTGTEELEGVKKEEEASHGSEVMNEPEPQWKTGGKLSSATCKSLLRAFST